MQRKLYLPLLILISSLSVSCKGTLPVRPQADVCMVSAPEPSEADPVPFQGCLCSDGVKTWRLSFAECDKYVAFRPDHFQALALYIIEVEKLAHKQCGLAGSPARAFVNEVSWRYRDAWRARTP